MNRLSVDNNIIFLNDEYNDELNDAENVIIYDDIMIVYLRVIGVLLEFLVAVLW